MIPQPLISPAFQTATPELSVIVPTCNRSAALADLLVSIATQTLDRSRYEVLVIDDGSDGVHCEAIARLTAGRSVAGLPLAVFFQKGAGPAAARNAMVNQARAALVLFLNDDVTLCPDHFAAHLAWHADHPEEQVVVRGKTDWRPVGRETAAMRYLRRRLFVYDLDLPEGDAHIVYFHTCDLSMKTGLVRRFPFDTSFPWASFEDSELGYRLHKAVGMRLILAEDALSEHHHDYRGRDLMRRARINGRSAAMIIARHPELVVRLRDAYLQPRSRRRVGRALWALVRGDLETFWEQVDVLIYLRHLKQGLAAAAGDAAAGQSA